MSSMPYYAAETGPSCLPAIRPAGVPAGVLHLHDPHTGFSRMLAFQMCHSSVSTDACLCGLLALTRLLLHLSQQEFESAKEYGQGQGHCSSGSHCWLQW